jgi:hypothetical protein
MRYNEKNASELLTIESFPSDDTRALTRHLEMITEQNGRIKNPVFHATLPFPPGEVLDSQTYIDIARDYMQGMGYGAEPYAVFLHTDKEHLHLHIVSSRVSAKTFRKLDAYCERWRSQCVGAIIERKYGITSVLDKKLPTALRRIADGYFERQVSIEEYFKNWRRQPEVRTLKKELRQQPEVSNKTLLQVNNAVADAMRQKPRSLVQLKDMLKPHHVEVVTAVNRKTGKQQGVVFVLHRQDVRQPTVEAVERGIPSGQLPCFSAAPLMQQLYANRREYKAAQSYLRKQLTAALKRAKTREALEKMLQKQNVLTTWHENARGIYGVSFTYKNVTLKGVQVGKKFSFEKIAARLELNTAAAAAVGGQAVAQEQRHSGSIGGGGGGGSKEDEDDEEEDEVTGQKTKRRKH